MEEKDDSRFLRLISWNVHHWRNGRMEFKGEEMKKMLVLLQRNHSNFVISLQEVVEGTGREERPLLDLEIQGIQMWGNIFFFGLFFVFRHFAPYVHKSQWGIATLSRSLSDTYNVMLPYSRVFIFTNATSLNIPTFHVHFDHQFEPTRLYQLNLVLEEARQVCGERAHLIIGDFNRLKKERIICVFFIFFLVSLPVIIALSVGKI